MGKKPIGPATKFSRTSRGGEYNINNFYHTRYNNEYGNEFLEPRKGFPTGTGYATNIRPQIFYKQSLDELDNPYMGHLLSGNYESITRRHYKGSKGSNGKDHFPNNAYQNGYAPGAENGFTKQRAMIGIPTSHEVRSVNFNTRSWGGVARPGLEPVNKITLRKAPAIRKDPVEDENYYHGPSSMKSEMATRYRGLGPRAKTGLKDPGIGKDIGKIEETGWLVNTNIEPLTYIPKNAYDSKLPETINRPVGISIKQQDFTNYEDQNGREVFPTVTNTSMRKTGFTRGPHMQVTSADREGFTFLKEYHPTLAEQVKWNDPAEYSNMKYPKTKISTIQTQYQGKQRPAPSFEKTIDKEAVGFKENSGECWNNVRYVPSLNYDRKRYLTHYNKTHYDMNPHGINRMGWTMGGVQGLKRDGFIHNSGVHSYGKDVDANRKLVEMHPFVAKTIKNEDRFWGENIHVHKSLPHSHDHYYKVNARSTATLETPAY